MRPTIFVLNAEAITPFPAEDIRQALTEPHYETLCQQYGLPEELIPVTLAAIAIRAAPSLDFFIVAYRHDRRYPIVATQIAAGQAVRDFVRRARLDGLPERVMARINALITIEFSIPTEPDLGRVVAYELARWAAAAGKGIVRGVDGGWYRLNRHRAFIPIGNKTFLWQ